MAPIATVKSLYPPPVRRNTVFAIAVLLIVILVMGVLGVIQMQDAILR